jgi:hypothetical protein
MESDIRKGNHLRDVAVRYVMQPLKGLGCLALASSKSGFIIFASSETIIVIKLRSSYSNSISSDYWSN